MNTKEMSYKKIFDSLKVLKIEERLDLMKSGYDYMLSILTPLCQSKESAKVLFIMLMSTFMFADDFVEPSDINLLTEFFGNEISGPDMLHVLHIADDSKEKIINSCDELILANEYDFLDHLLIVGITICSSNGKITENEKLLALHYLNVYMSK